VDDVAIVSTSRAAIERVLGTRGGKTPSLAGAADYRCLRAIAPGGAPSEEAFIYLSDAFVRRVVGPDLKIAEARRVECVACLRTIENAALLFRIENGRDPKDLVEMWPEYVKDGALACPSGGAYSFTSGGARCLVHGSLAALRPCIETPVTMVTPTESRDYDRFARRYNDYWRQYFDPVAIRVALGDTVRAETTILPLVENSAYDAARGWVGGAAAAPIGPEPASAIAVLGARIDLRSILPDAMTCRGLREKFGVDVERAAAKAFGPEVAIDVGDGDMRFDFRLERYLGGALGGGQGVDLYLLPALAGLSLPVCARVSVRDREAAGAFVREVRDALARESARPSLLPSMPRFSTYDLAPHRGVPVSVVAMEALSFKVRVFHALLDDAWIVSNQEAFLREAIDRRLEHGAAGGAPAHAKLEMLPQAWRQAKSALLLSYEEAARLACARNLGVAGHVLRATRGASDAERRALERRVFGQLGVCPDGGTYREGADGLAECTIHGTLLASKQPAEPVGDAPFGRLIARLQAVRLTARFTEDGLQTTVEIERR
ncbi:MAG: hypothetical protein HYR85_09200, partial [Planctomycetes bacterium]|nr:hypothetical protein [Planctomycetota bacterium]